MDDELDILLYTTGATIAKIYAQWLSTDRFCSHQFGYTETILLAGGISRAYGSGCHVSHDLTWWIEETAQDFTSLCELWLALTYPLTQRQVRIAQLDALMQEQCLRAFCNTRSLGPSMREEGNVATAFCLTTSLRSVMAVKNFRW